MNLHNNNTTFLNKSQVKSNKNVNKFSTKEIIAGNVSLVGKKSVILNDNVLNYLKNLANQKLLILYTLLNRYATNVKGMKIVGVFSKITCKRILNDLSEIEKIDITSSNLTKLMDRLELLGIINLINKSRQHGIILSIDSEISTMSEVEEIVRQNPNSFQLDAHINRALELKANYNWNIPIKGYDTKDFVKYLVNKEIAKKRAKANLRSRQRYAKKLKEIKITNKIKTENTEKTNNNIDKKGVQMEKDINKQYATYTASQLNDDLIEWQLATMSNADDVCNIDNINSNYNMNDLNDFDCLGGDINDAHKFKSIYKQSEEKQNKVKFKQNKSDDDFPIIFFTEYTASFIKDHTENKSNYTQNGLKSKSYSSKRKDIQAEIEKGTNQKILDNIYGLNRDKRFN